MKKVLWSALLVVGSLGLMAPVPVMAQDVSEDVIKALEEAAQKAKEKEQADKAAADKAAAEKAAAEKAAAEKAAAEKAAAEKAAAEKLAAEKAAAEKARQEAEKKARMEAEARKAAESALDDPKGEKDIHRLYESERKRLMKDTGQPVDEKPAAPKPVVPPAAGPGNSPSAPSPNAPSAVQKPPTNPVPTFQPGQKPVTPESNAPDYRRAIELLLQGASSTNAMVRANSLEALHLVPQRAKPLVLKALNDPNEGVRFTATMSAGMLKLVDLAPAIRPLLKDTSRSVQAAAIYALFVMKQDVNISPLAEMLMSQDRVLRSNVALVLGEMGESSAIGLLKSSLRAPMPRESKERMAVLRIYIAEAMLKLGDTASLEALRAGAYSSLGEVQAAAITAMGATGDKSMVKAIERFLYDPKQTKLESIPPRYPIEVKLAAAGALGRLGVETGLNIALQSLSDPNPIIASQAAWALGWYKDAASLARLQAALEHPNELVQVSVAASILRRQALGGLAGPGR